MPPKHEHVLTCNLSKRQRQLYDEYMARSETRSVMAGGNFMGVVGVLMQLRKVCALTQVLCVLTQGLQGRNTCYEAPPSKLTRVKGVTKPEQTPE